MNDAGTTEGDVWSFTTGGAPVVVVSFAKDNYRSGEEPVPIGPWNLEIQIVQDDKKEEDEQYRDYIEPTGLQDPETGHWDSIDSDIVCGRCSATITIVDND